MISTPCFGKAYLSVIVALEIGDRGELPTSAIATTKLQGEAERLQVYERLFALGFEGSFVTDICPVAPSGRWDACPFRDD